MRALAGQRRFEEAAALRDRTDALARALARQRRFDALRQAGWVQVEIEGEGVAELHRGRLVSCPSPALVVDAPRPGRPPVAVRGRRPRLDPGPGLPFEVCTGYESDGDEVPSEGPLPARWADELACVAAWLDAKADQVRIVQVDAGLATRLPRVPRFQARPSSAAAPTGR